jgi:protein TonB
MHTSLTVSLPHRPRRGHAPLHTWRAWAIRISVLAVAVSAGLYARRHLVSDNAHPYNRVQRIALVSPQRVLPPKDDKPKEEPPKELDIQKPQLSLNEPAEAAPPGEKPHDDQLGVDADGEGAGDGFGLTSKRGGRDITTLGPGGEGGNGTALSSGMNRFNFGAYGGLVRQRLQSDLAAAAALRERDYVVVVWIWIDAHGRIERVELPHGSGFADIDTAMRNVLAQMPLLPEPPSSLPQPLRLRVTAREIDAKRN